MNKADAEALLQDENPECVVSGGTLWLDLNLRPFLHRRVKLVKITKSGLALVERSGRSQTFPLKYVHDADPWLKGVPEIVEE